MKFKGFDRDFWVAVAITIPLLVGLLLFSIFLNRQFGISVWVVILFVGGVLYFGFDWFVKRQIKRNVESEASPVFCEWGSRIDRTTFRADEETTLVSLEELGHNIDSALGKTFTCVTVCFDDKEDYYFEGEVRKTENGSIIIKAIKPEQLPG